MAFRPGELDQRITIMRDVETPDGYGGNTTVPTLIHTLWSLVRPISGNEITDYDRINAKAKYLFVVRYPIDILDSDRIEWEGTSFNIRLRKKPKGRDLYMQIEAERGVSQ